MKRGNYRPAKTILMFNGAYTLVSIFRSARTIAELSGTNAQSISFACNGKYISAGAFYYRHMHPNVIVDLDDINKLKLQEYDGLCKEPRQYHSTREMARRRRIIADRRRGTSLNIDENEE